MASYRIIVLPTEECNPEYAPEKDLQEGIEVDGFAIVTQREETPYSEGLMAMSVDMLSKWMRKKSQAGNIFRAAAGKADADIRAVEILKENERKANGLTELLMKIMEGAGHGD